MGEVYGVEIQSALLPLDASEKYTPTILFPVII